ncbi:MAG: hypothetical protein KGL78_02395 [Burkholderiales bacterium]|nr:hypothetical protein [Burkholderiales bacterium]
MASHALARARRAAIASAPVALTMLLAFAALAWLARTIAIDLEIYVLAALLPILIVRLPHAHGAAEQARDGVVIAAAALVAVELPALVDGQPLPGTLALIACAVASKALRGRGRAAGIAAAGAGLALRLALISLVAPGRIDEAWRAPLAVALVGWSYGALALFARLVGHEPAADRRASGASAEAGARAAAAAPAAIAASRAVRSFGRKSATLQMLLAFSASCVAGRWWFGAHWNWAALSAFLVLSGTLTRAEIMTKGLHRLVGAAAGTSAAALLVGPGGAGSRSTLLALLAVVMVSIWLRRLAYAGWVAGITAALSLLYSYEGQDAGALLGVRLAALACGAVLAIAAGWFVMPVRRAPDSRAR